MSDTDALTAGIAAADELMGTEGGFLSCGTEALVRTVLTAAGWLDDEAQPTPARTDEVEGAHDRAITWMSTANHFRILRERGEIQYVIAGLVGRKAFGLRKYGTTLNPDGRRDPLADTLGEVLDAIAYAQIGLDEAEGRNDGQAYSFWWQRRSRLTDEAVELYRERARLADQAGAWPERVDVGVGAGEGDEAALAVRADRSEG